MRVNQSAPESKPGGSAGAPPPAGGSTLRGVGYAQGAAALSPGGHSVRGLLDQSSDLTRARLQPLLDRFGVQLGSVRIHLEPQGGGLGALAYTERDQIHLGLGPEGLESPEAHETLAHELTHVVQQRQGSQTAAPEVEEAEDELEGEADEVGEAVGKGAAPPSVDKAAGPGRLFRKKRTRRRRKKAPTKAPKHKPAAPSSGGLSAREIADAVRWYKARPSMYPESVVRKIQAAVGAYVDGDLGPKTVKAIASWQASHGLEVDGLAGPATLQAMFKEDIRPDKPPAGDDSPVEGGLRRPHGLGDINKVFGKAGKNIVSFAMRAGKGGKMLNVPCNKKLGPILQAVFQDIWNAGLSEHIHTYDGCYNYRPKRSNSNALSTHSWGIAVDINASANPMTSKKKMKISDSQRVIAPYFEKHGFYWGAAFGDPMHFQYCTGY